MRANTRTVYDSAQVELDRAQAALDQQRRRLDAEFEAAWYERTLTARTIWHQRERERQRDSAAPMTNERTAP